MKNLRSIYILLIGFLLGFISFACSDDDMEQTEEKNDRGNSVASEFVVNIGASDIAVDLDTRADANISSPKPENGGKFQNIVVVLADKSNKIYDIRCEKWYGNEGPSESVGVDACKITFSSHGITERNGVVFALGNVSAESYDIISEYRISQTKSLSELPELNKLMNGTISADNLYNLNFTSKTGSYKINGDEITTCAGMPMNAMAYAELNSDKEVVFNVKMKRVCARMQMKFKNSNGWSNAIYVENFIIKNMLAKKSKYFYDGSVSSNIESQDFSLLQALGKNNNHTDNKIDGNDWTLSMYVFESFNGSYNYDFKIDKGKQLGNSTRYFEKGNAYVIWNKEKTTALACDNGSKKLVFFRQYNSTDFNEYSKIFWELEEDSPGTGIYALKHYPMDNNSLLIPNTNNYLARQQIGNDNLYLDMNAANPTDQNKSTVVQYVYFNYSGSDECSILFCNGPSDLTHKMEERYRYLTVATSWGNPDHLENCRGKKNSGPTDHADWALYSKYIIKKGEPLKEDKDGEKKIISKIKRNNNYEMEFTVTTKSETETFLYVKSGDRNNITYREQNSVSCYETQK